MLELLILGTAGHAREIAWLAESVEPGQSQWRLGGHACGDPAELGQDLDGRPVRICDRDLAADPTPRALALGIATPALARRVLAALLAAPQFTFPNLIHPGTLYRAASVRFGRGNLVCAGSLLTTGITVGDFNLLNRGVQVGHDCRIGRHNVLNPGAILSGGVSLGDGCMVGSGAVILQNLSIGDGAVIGAGAVVTRAVPAGATVVGVPARALEKN